MDKKELNQIIELGEQFIKEEEKEYGSVDMIFPDAIGKYQDKIKEYYENTKRMAKKIKRTM